MPRGCGYLLRGCFYYNHMAKDPAFLFYSKDFYEGTRTMLPNERACFIDLLIYQHQHEIIPLDLERVLMYCSGVSEATLQATLQAKFKHTDKGWYNEKLMMVIENRKEFTGKQSDNGVVGQFFKKAKQSLNSKLYLQLRDYVFTDYSKERMIHELKNGQTHEALLEAMLKHLAIVNANAIEDNKLKGVEPEIFGSIPPAPELSDFQKHFEDTKNKLDPKKYTEAWQYYMLDGNGMDAKGNRLNIHNFKQKISNLAESKGWIKEVSAQPIKIKMNDGR
jgi:hypothetical protein